MKQRPATLADWLTVERLLFGAILLIGAAVRLTGLADQSLSPAEAASAWPAWLRAMGLTGPFDAAPTSALLFSIQTLLFWITGGGDAVARMGSALTGIALVWLPWLWRSWLGRSVALTVALLVAIDPWLVAFSRHASGASITVLLFAIVLTCLFYLYQGQDVHTTYRVWVALALMSGLLLTSGPLAWSTIPILAGFIWLYGRPRLASGEENGTTSGSGLLLILLFFGALLLGSTTWLSHPQGIAHIGNSFSVWFGQISSGAFPFAWVWLRFLTEQSLLLIVALAGLILLWRGSGAVVTGGRQRWAAFLILWLCWSIVLLLLPGRTPETLLIAGLALILAAGHTLGAVLANTPRNLDWREAGIALVVIVILLISIAFWGRILLASPQLSMNNLAIVLLLIVSLVLILAIYMAWAGRRAALWLAGVTLSALLVIGSLSSLWQLSHSHDVSMPDGFFAVQTAPDTRLLAQDIATLSAQRAGDAGEIPLQVQMMAEADPVLGWYLRDMRRLDWVLTPDLSSVTLPQPLAVTWDDALAADVDYMGGAYDLRMTWSPISLWGTPIPMVELGEQLTASERLQERLNGMWRSRLQPTLRWLIYREAPISPAMDEVILWAPVLED